MEYREDGGRGAQIAWIGGQFLGGRGGATKQEAINDLGMLIGQRPQGRRQSEGQQIMRTRQQARLLFLQPGGGLLAMAFGAMPVTAGMIGIAERCAVITLRHMAAEKRGATKFDVAHRPELMRKQRVIGVVDRSVSAENIRHFDHGQRSWISCWIGASSCAQAGAVK